MFTALTQLPYLFGLHDKMVIANAKVIITQLYNKRLKAVGHNGWSRCEMQRWQGLQGTKAAFEIMNRV